MKCENCAKLGKCGAVEAIVARREKYGDHPKACDVDETEREDARITATECTLRMELKQKEVEINRVRAGETKLTAQRDEARRKLGDKVRQIDELMEGHTCPRSDKAEVKIERLESDYEAKSMLLAHSTKTINELVEERKVLEGYVKELTFRLNKPKSCNNTQKLVYALQDASGRLLREALDCLQTHELAEIARAVHGRIYKRLNV